MDVTNWLNHSSASNVNVQKNDFDDESECILIFNYHNWIKTFTEIKMNGNFFISTLNAIFSIQFSLYSQNCLHQATSFNAIERI